MKVFWSWQGDTPGKVGRHFVREALESAIGQLREDLTIAEPDRSELHLDHDRKDVPGSPDLAQTILDKIQKSSIFIADVTPVGKTDSGKPLLNSNVSIELGYALAHLSDKRLLMILNSAWGVRESLPFDLRHKAGPIIFTLSADADTEERTRVGRSLVGVLKEAIKACLISAQTDSTPDDEERQRLEDAQQPTWKTSNFIGDGELLARLVPFGRIEDAKEIVWHNGPQMFLRIIPLTPWKDRSPTELERILLNRNAAVLPLGGAESLWHHRNKYGAVVFDAQENQTSAYRFTQVFKNGEIWGVDRYLFGHNAKESKIVALNSVRKILQFSLPNYLQFAENILELEPPLHAIVGISGVEGYFITDSSSFRTGGVIVDDEVIQSQRIDAFEQGVEEVEAGFLGVLLDACGLA